MMGRIGQDFVVTRTKSVGNGCSMAVDFKEKGFYSSYTPNHAFLMEKNALKRYARRLNWPYLLNLYCVKDLYGAYGSGAFAPSPEYRVGPVHFMAVRDQRDYRTAAHELGHVLSLYHESPEENLMHPYAPVGHPELELRSVQIMVARTHAKRYLRAAAYLTDISNTFRDIRRRAEYELPLFRSYFGEGLGEIRDE